MADLLRKIEHHHWGIILSLVMIGCLLRIQGLDWDQWLRFHPDERNLVDAASTLSFPNKMIPDFHAYNGLALYVPRFIAWILFIDNSDPKILTWAARFAAAMYGTASIFVGALIGYRLGGPLVAAVAAFLLCISEPLIQWSHFGTTESAIALTVLLLWWLSMRLHDAGISAVTVAFWSALVLGLGLGYKTSALSFSVIPAAAFLVLFVRERTIQIPVMVVGAGVSIFVFLLTTPSIIFATRDYLDIMILEGQIVRGTADVFWTWQFVDATNVLFELRSLWQLLDGGILLMSFAGIVIVCRKKIEDALPILLFLLVYCCIVFFWHAKFVRYLAPIVPVLLVFASAALAACLVSSLVTLHVVSICLVVVFVASGSSMALSFQSIDSRIAADRYLQKFARDGDIIAREPVEIGAPLSMSGNVKTLPYLVPSSSKRLTELSVIMASADWFVVNSRRHWSVLSKQNIRRHFSTLPRLDDRFTYMCGYFAALKAGDFGLHKVARFHRWQPLRRLFYPGINSEETRVVFDRPETIVFKRMSDINPEGVMNKIRERELNCRPEPM